MKPGRSLAAQLGADAESCHSVGGGAAWVSAGLVQPSEGDSHLDLLNMDRGI